MKLKELYLCMVECGMNADPRGREEVSRQLQDAKERFAKIEQDEKKDFDPDKLTNPYADTRILNGTGEEDISSILCGIDIEAPEILLAHALKAQGKKIDLVLSHHPEGNAYANFYQVIGMQADILNRFGVPIAFAESVTDTRLKEVSRKVLPQNHQRAVDAARLLGIAFMSTHTVADNHVASFLQKLFDDKKPYKLSDVTALLKELPEYAQAAKTGTGPVILNGAKDSRAGKVFVDMTGGTEGAKEIIAKLADSGVGTIVGMHMSEDHFKEAQKHHINVVIAGHISSDNLGMNLLFDAAEKKCGKLEVLECSGFRRVHRR